MTNVIDEIRHFFEHYRRVYGQSIFLEQPLKPDRELAEPRPQKPKAAPPPKPAVSRAKHIPQRSPELEEFYRQIKDCQKCPLGKTRKNFVFGYGNPKAEVMFIGEAPGREEDEQGLPFVGAAGKLLDKMLQAIGLSRDDVYIANVLKCRPPNNRDPLPDEVVKCEPYLKKQLELIQPKILVALGRVAGQSLLKTTDSLSRLRSTEHTYQDKPLIITYHPAALLRNPRWKAQSWEDLKKLKKLLQK